MIAVIFQIVGQFPFAASKMAFHRVDRHFSNQSYPVYSLSFYQLQRNTHPLIAAQHAECALQVHLQAAVGVVIGACRRRNGADILRRMPAADIVVIYVIGNTIQPGEERRLALKLADMRVSLYKCVLRQVITQLTISPSLVQKESPYRRLVFPHKLVIRPPVMENSHLCNQTDVVKLIQRRSLCGFANHQLPHTVAGKHKATAYKETGFVHKRKHNSYTYTY